MFHCVLSSEDVQENVCCATISQENRNSQGKKNVIEDKETQTCLCA